jgi:Zn-finger nucleic acid-binding protein
MELTCPKCHGTMRTYERNGVHVDQCTECRGIFLDRGELERLIDAENDWHERGRPQQAPPSQHAAPPQQSGYAPTGSAGGLGAVVNEVLSQVGKPKSSHGSYGHGHQKKRKESFLSDLFG